MFPNQVSPMPNGNYPPQQSVQGNPPKGYPAQGQPYDPQQSAHYGDQSMLVPPRPFQSGLDILMSLPGIFVKQKFQLLQALTGCETQNQFMICPANVDGSPNFQYPLFQAKEKSGFCVRQFLSPHCRPFNMKVEHEGSGVQFLWLHRECTCTFWCLNRPYLEVYFSESGKEPGDYLGKIVNPFKWCNAELCVLGKENDVKYIIWGDCCQLGFLCKMPFQPCQTVDFNILDGSRNPTDGRLQKRTAGCWKSAISDTSNFSLVFPTKATREERALLTAAVIMLDFMYFQESPDQNDQN